MPHILGPCLRLISSSVQLGCPSHDSSGHNGHTFGRYPKPSSLGQSLRVIIWQLRHPQLAVLCLKLFQKAPRGSSRQHKKGGRAWQGMAGLKTRLARVLWPAYKILQPKTGNIGKTSPAIFWDLPNGFHHKKRQDTLRLAFCPCRAWGRRASNGFPLQNPGMRWCGMSAQMIKWTSSPKIGSDSFKMFLGC